MSDGRLQFQVNINGAPVDFGLKRAKQLLQERLEDGSSVRNINYSQTPDGSLIKSVIVAELTRVEYVTKLLDDPIVEEEFKDSLHKLLLTKPTPQITSANNSKHFPRIRSPNAFVCDDTTAINTSQFPSGNYDRSRKPMAGQFDQRSLYVIQIPDQMYDDDIMREHFERFGEVTNLYMPRGRPTRFAIVEYDTHKSAQLALENASDLSPLNTSLRITWNNRQGPQFNAGPARGQPRGRPTRGYPRGKTSRGLSPARFPMKQAPIRKIKSEGNFQEREIQVVEAEPVSWATICKRDKDWFAGPVKRCIVVQEIPLRVTNTKLRAYFENEQLSGGGPVNRMEPLVDGVLIEFKDNKTADNVCRRNDHEIDSTALRVYRKPIPTLFNDRFVVKGKFGNSSNVRELIEYCDDTSDFIVEEHNEPDSYFVKYAKSFDIKKLTKLVEKAALDVKPMIYQLCHTDCLLVEGLCSDVSDDAIKLVFMNKKKTNGGDVTAVKRKSTSDAAIIYFANFRDAQNVLEHSKQNSILVIGNEVQVSYCYGGLIKMQRDKSKQHATEVRPRGRKGKAPPFAGGLGIKAFDYVTECDSDVIEFITRSSLAKNDLSKVFFNVAQIKFNKNTNVKISGWVASFYPLPKQKMSKNLQNDQGAFESECTSLLLQFLGKFGTQLCQLDNLKLRKIRGAYDWKDEDDFIKVDVSEKCTFPAFVRWSTSAGDTKVSGYLGHLNAIINWLNQCCGSVEVVGKYNAEEFQFLQEFGIITDIRNMFHGTVEIQEDNKAHTLTFKSPSRKAEEAKEKIMDKLQNVGKNNLSFLDENQKIFLKEVLKAGGSDIESLIKLQFKQDNVKAVLRRLTSSNYEPVLYYYQNEDLIEAKKALTDVLATRTIHVKSDYDSIVHGRSWERLEQSISSENCRLYKDSKKSTVTLVGMISLVDGGHNQIMDYCKASATKTKDVTLSYLYVSFIKHFPKESEADIHLKRVEWQISSVNEGRISLRGKSVEVDKAVNWLEQSFQSSATTVETIKEPGMAMYFHGTSGEQFLQTTQTLSKCFISLDSGSTPHQQERAQISRTHSLFSKFKNLVGFFESSKTSQTSPTTPSAQPSSSLRVSVLQGDIASATADVIVTCTAPQSFASASGSATSKAICRKAGEQLQTYCQALAVTSASSLYPGNVLVTPGFNMTYKKIYHVLLDRYNKHGDSDVLYSDSIQQCLLMAEKDGYSRIAFPALGTGGMSYPSNLVASWFNQQISKFQGSSLQNVDIVIFPSDHSTFTEFSNTFSKSIHVIHPSSNAFNYAISASNKPSVPSRPMLPSPVARKSHREVSAIPIETSSSDAIQMYFCSKEEKNINEAWRKISDHVKEKSLRKEKDVDFDSLGIEGKHEILNLEKKHSVTMQIQSAGKSNRLVIAGIKDNVLEAYTAASEIIQEYKEALTCAKYVMWKYNDLKTNQLADFPLRTSLKIELQYKKNPQSKLMVQALTNNTESSFHIDLTTMTATTIDSNNTFKIVRIIKTSGLPQTWENMDGKPWKNFVVSPNSQEYQQVLTFFNRTGPIKRPVSLERIQNPTLYHQFQAQKRKVEARMKAKGSSLPISRDLFHGTSPDVCESIYKDGFDRSHCGKNATAFGKGVYFATTCRYSQGYAHADNQGCRRMFLAEVITGEFHQGNSSLRTPNFMDVTKKERYDSVVDNMTNPAMFVVFKDASVYPKYILKYQ